MKILFITLSNIGDCILTLPVLDALRKKYPRSQITCLVPPRPREIFIGNPAVSEVIIFDKYSGLADKLKLFFALSRQNFDLVVDLRNSFFGAFLPAKRFGLSFAPLRRIPPKIRHMSQKHLFWAGLSGDLLRDDLHRSLNIVFEDTDYIRRILKEHNLPPGAKLIVVSPGARSQTKCWSRQNFARLCQELIRRGYWVALAGDAQDKPVCDYLEKLNPQKSINFCGATKLTQLAALLKAAQALVTNDSAVMHLASYLDLPVVAIFGPTDEKKYGPWSSNCAVVKKDIFCRPCEKAQCRFGDRRCLSAVTPQDVLAQLEIIIGDKKGDVSPGGGNVPFKRILIVRTDRLGDVLLSTPAVKALRQNFPQSYIAMMVSPYTKEAVDGNPDLDEVIAFDKEGKDKGWLGGLKFAAALRKKKFDLVLILHPTRRMHILMFLAGIRRRLGYDRKFKFLLTDRIRHTKQSGAKHESEYVLDFVRYLGIRPEDKALFMPLSPESEKWARDLFNSLGIQDKDKILAIHPTASCPSRIWPAERFARVADILAEKYGFKVVVVSGAKDMQKAQEVIKNMHQAALELSGRTSVSQLASVLKRCQLFISTDSGPMHIACAIGVPVITIFGRNQAGLSPRRWGPLGKNNRVLHKTVGCQVCLAHNCSKDFACLKAVTVEDVLQAAEEILS